MRKSKSVVYRQMAAVAVLAGCAASSQAAVLAWNLVPTLDPNNGSYLTVNDAASNTTTADGVSLASFTTQVATAYSANLGGVINWDGSGANSSQLTAVPANYTGTTSNASAGFVGNGTTAAAPIEGFLGSNTVGGGIPSSTPLISLLRTDSSATAGASLDWNNNQGNILASGNASSGGYLGIQGTTGFTLTFQPAAGVGLTEFGITSIPRDASGQTSTGYFVATFSNGSTYTTSTDVVNATTATPATAVFYGIQAPAGDTISSVAFTDTGSNSARFDDAAFIVSPVPEPASLGLIGLASLGLLRRSRRNVARI